MNKKDVDKKIILISDFIEQKLRKETELEFYEKELRELQVKIGYLRREVNLTNTIIGMIKTENVIDFKEELWKNTPDITKAVTAPGQLNLPLDKKDDDKDE